MTATAKGPRPWFKHYATEWMGRPDIRSLSLAAKGLLMDLRCIAHQSPTYGHLVDARNNPLNAPRIKALIPGVDGRAFAHAFRELEENIIITRATNGAYLIPDMVSAWEQEEKDRANGRSGGSPHLRTPAKGVNPPLNPPLNPPDKGGDNPNCQSQSQRGNPQPSILLPLPARKAAPAPAVAVETPRGPQRAWWSGVPHKPSTGGGIAIGPYTRRDGTKGVGAWKLEGIEADIREAVGWAEGFGDWSAMAEWLCEEIEWPVIIDAIRERTKQKTYRGCTSLRFFDKMVRAAWQAHETQQRREAM